MFALSLERFTSLSIRVPRAVVVLLFSHFPSPGVFLIKESDE